MDRLVKGYCIGKSSKDLKVPTLKYLKVLSDETEKPVSTVRVVAEEYFTSEFTPQRRVLEKTKLKQSNVTDGMYNAVVDTEDIIDVDEVFDKIKNDGNFFKMRKVDGIEVKPLQVLGRYGKFMTAFEMTSEYGLKTKSNREVNSLDITFRLNGVQGASMSIYSSGRIRFSAGYLQSNREGEPKTLIKFIRKYMEIPNNAEPMINNMTGSYRINMSPSLVQIYGVFDPAVVKGLTQYRGMEISVKYEPEAGQAIARRKQRKNSPFLYINFDKNFSIVLSTGKIVQIEGSVDLPTAVGVAKDFMEELKNGLLLEGSITNNLNANSVPKPSKITRRADNLPAPDVTRRGTSCHPSRRPIPYSFQGKCPQGDKFYVKPNPQGQPCCYRIPKSTIYSTRKVESAYSKAGVRVPENVRDIFGIGRNTNNKPLNVSKNSLKIETYTNDKSGFKIGSRQCTRYSKVALMDIAKRMGVKNVPKVISKPKLCKMIEDTAKAGGMNRTNEYTRKALIVRGRLMIGRRFCDSYPKNEIIKFARTEGVNLDENMTKEEMCEILKSKFSQNTIKDLRITRQQMKENLNKLGAPSTNENVNKLLNFIKSKNINANKNEVNRLKREFVNMIKKK